MRLADRAARLYAPLVHATAALTAIGWLVAGRFRSRIHRQCHRRGHHHLPTRDRACCPGRVGVAAGTLFGSGVVLNGGDAIERLAEADTIVFDKTER